MNPNMRDWRQWKNRTATYQTPDQALWASQFECTRHGIATYAMVSTKKTCMVPLENGSVCDEGFIRHPVPGQFFSDYHAEHAGGGG